MIHILLPVHNRRVITEAFVRALLRQTDQDFHLTLIDDGSTDGTASAVTALLGERVSVLRGKGSWWWAGALQQGFRSLGPRHLEADDVVLICNDDVVLPDDFLDRGRALLAENPGSFVIAKAQDPVSGTPSESCFAIDYRHCRVLLARPGEVAVCGPTRGLFIRWQHMRQVGGFHPWLLPHYLSDLEWTARAVRKGLRLVRDDRLWLTPNHEASGLHSLTRLTVGLRLRRLFSPRYAGNPLAWGAFILLAFPKRYWPFAFPRVLLWTVAALLRG